jgi:alkanesulfonate monooxygenase SsuD/methylene tetrahydromethanopterin reductase-like flavin-dependent oxidoreductase (luciferase family)
VVVVNPSGPHHRDRCCTSVNASNTSSRGGRSVGGRGSRLDDTLDVLESYWTKDEFAHQGPLFTVPETVVGLKPEQRPGPSVLLAAFTPAGLRRVARRAAGCLPVSMPLALLLGMWRSIVEEAERASVQELFIDFGHTPATLDECLDMADRFLEGVRKG